MNQDPKIDCKLFANPKRTPRTRLTCYSGEKLDIFFAPEGTAIGGVYASNEFWRNLFNNQLPK